MNYKKSKASKNKRKNKSKEVFSNKEWKVLILWKSSGYCPYWDECLPRKYHNSKWKLRGTLQKSWKTYRNTQYKPVIK